ncbi:uncharacterized protein LOC131692635 [Topomyia yanbarensis]|uniref:uncharacterized protein LOC131692635 n=1 Tax=Topomyia yanbarensis TaxID=2498891 RepID=UPI00273ABC49|nr:uncharacterized protein LOC131692635 [Topomyia yanbarensis]
MALAGLDLDFEPERTEESPPKPINMRKLRMLEKRKARKEAAEERKRKVVRDQLIREQKYTLGTEKRAFANWEQMCSDVRFQDIWEEMLQVKQNVQMLFDRKNAYIDRLFNDRFEIEDIYSKNLQRLKRLIRCYSEIHQYFNESLSAQYQEECKHRLTEFRRETVSKEGHGNECTEQMEGALISLEEAMAQGLVDDRVDFIKKNDDTINAHIEKRDKLRDRKVNQLGQLHGEIKSVVNDYFATILHPEKEKAYYEMFDRDQTSRKVIADNRVKIKELNSTIKRLNKKLVDVEIAGTRKVITKRFAKRNTEQDLDTLKRKLIKMDEDQMERMKELSYDAFHVYKYVNELAERGRLILSLAQNCTKFETADDVKYFKKRIDQGPGSTDCPSEFEFFFDKINRAKAINVLKLAERDQLLQTNRELQRKFQEYCKLNSPKADMSGFKLIVKGIESSEGQK